MSSALGFAEAAREHWAHTPWVYHTVLLGAEVPEIPYTGQGPPGFTPRQYRVATSQDDKDHDSIETLRAYLLANPGAPLPGLALGVPREYGEVITGVGQQRAVTQETLLGRVREGKPSHGFLWHTSLYSTVLRHVAQDCSDALSGLGYVSRVIMEDPGDTDCILAMLEYQACARPRVAVAIDYTRNLLYHPEMVHVCWIQDEMPHLEKLATVASVAPQDRIFACSSIMQEKYSKIGYSDVGLLPFGYNEKRFACDHYEECTELKVAFISNLDNPYDKVHGALNDWLVANEHTYGLDKERATSQAIATLRLRVSRPEREDLLSYVWKVLRHQNLLRWAGVLRRNAVPFVVYGLGWGDTEFASNWEGSISPESVKEVYRKHLAILGVQPNLLLHPRVMECYASGGICVQSADESSPRERLENAVYYTSEEELLDRVASLAHPPERERISVAVRAELVNHTYSERMRQLVRDVYPAS